MFEQKNDEVRIDVKPKRNEEHIFVTYGCIRFTDSYRFLSSILDKLVETLVHNRHKTDNILKKKTKKLVGDDIMLNIVNEIEKKVCKDENKRTIDDLKVDIPAEIEKSEEALINYMGESNLKTLKKEFPDKWKNLTKKVAYPYEYFNCLGDYQKPVNDLKREDFISKLKKKSPSYEEMERTKQFVRKVKIRIVEELTRLYLKDDIHLFACVFEKFIKVSINELQQIHYIVLGYTWQCGWKYADNRLQTFQDKDLISLLENIVRGGMSSVMVDLYIKSDENKKVIYIDANNIYCQSISQMLLFDKIKFERNVCLEDILNTPGDSDMIVTCFLEVDLKYSVNIWRKTNHFPFAPENKFINKDDLKEYLQKIKPKKFITH